MSAVAQHDRRFVSGTGARLPVEVSRWCGPAGEPLSLEPGLVRLDVDRLRAAPASLWRYRDVLPFAAGSPWPERVSMGEGWTPLVPVRLDGQTVLGKLEFLMPTLSFKDRGAAVLVAKAAELGADRLVADSSGNAGTAIAAYSARAGLACEVFVPDSASPAKTAQMEAHGATIVRVRGTREDAAAAAIARVTDTGAHYASHVYNAFFLEGTKTYAYEIWEAVGVPDVVVVPVGNGTLLLGALIGFDELRRAGLADRTPTVVAVQAAGCNPLARSFRDAGAAADLRPSSTIADGIAIAAPARGAEIVASVRSAGGLIVDVDDDAIGRAARDLARQGLFVEPTAAASWAAIADLGPRRMAAIAGREAPVVVAPLCGAGLKAVAAVGRHG